MKISDLPLDYSVKRTFFFERFIEVEPFVRHMHEAVYGHFQPNIFFRTVAAVLDAFYDILPNVTFENDNLPLISCDGVHLKESEKFGDGTLLFFLNMTSCFGYSGFVRMEHRRVGDEVSVIVKKINYLEDKMSIIFEHTYGLESKETVDGYYETVNSYLKEFFRKLHVPYEENKSLSSFLIYMAHKSGSSLEEVMEKAYALIPEERPSKVQEVPAVDNNLLGSVQQAFAEQLSANGGKVFDPSKMGH